MFNSLYDNIDGVFYINLKNQKKRKQNIENNLYKMFIDKKILKFNAVDYKDIFKYKLHFNIYLKKNISDTYSYNSFVKSYAAYYSHLCILKKLIEIKNKTKNNKLYIIFEDDTEITNDFIHELKSFNINKLKNWNIIMGANIKYYDDKNILNHKKKYNEFINLVDTNNKLYGASILIYNYNNLEYMYNKLLYNIIYPFNLSYYFIDMYLLRMNNVYIFNIKHLKENKFKYNSCILEKNFHTKYFLKNINNINKIKLS